MQKTFDYLDFYFGMANGEIPASKEDIEATKNTINYLENSGLSHEDIITLIINIKPKNKLTPNELPDYLWDDSLLKRDTFYFHKELQIVSPPPKENVPFKLYKEMKIKYTPDDVLNYFVKIFHVNAEWINNNKEIGSINYLLKQYEVYRFVEPIDFLLSLIDDCKSRDLHLNQILELNQYAAEFANEFNKKIKISVMKEKNKIIWRS